MKMKKITFVVMAMFLSFTFYSVTADAATTKTSTSIALVDKNPSASPEAKVLVKRLNEIKRLDMSDLKSSEKKALSKEVRSIRNQLEAMGGYIYVSAGALVLIVILLIILL
jgi:hypothetical protein